MPSTPDIPLRDGEQWAELFPRDLGVTAGRYRGVYHHTDTGKLVALFPAPAVDEMTGSLPLAQQLGGVSWSADRPAALTVQRDGDHATPHVLYPDERGLYDLSHWPWAILCHRDAVVHAAEAARRLQAAFPAADLLVFYPDGDPAAAVGLELWDNRRGQLLWSSAHDPQRMPDRPMILTLLAAAHSADPSVFEPADLPSDRRLRLPAVLEADRQLAAQRLAAHAIDDVGLTAASMTRLVNEVAAEKASGRDGDTGWAWSAPAAAGDPVRNAATAHGDGPLAQARFLLDFLGEYGAWVALESAG